MILKFCFFHFVQQLPQLEWIKNRLSFFTKNKANVGVIACSADKYVYSESLKNQDNSVILYELNDKREECFFLEKCFKKQQDSTTQFNYLGPWVG